MNIDKLSSLLPASQPESRDGPQKAERATPAGQQNPRGSTETQLSQGATDTAQDIDNVRVEELRNAINNGQLEVRTDQIADGLISSVEDLLAGGDTTE